MALSTGFLALDRALGGGLPAGEIAEFVGAPAASLAALALQLIARAQAANGLAVYLDLGQGFDAAAAEASRLDLNALILVRPADFDQGLALLKEFALGGLDLVAFDLPAGALAEPRPAQLLAETLGRIAAPLRRANCSLLFLSLLPAGVAYPALSPLPACAALRLLIRPGAQPAAEILKNPAGPAGVRVPLALTGTQKPAAAL
ncbi:MAG: hypothetical protein ACRDHL_02860 [Candidatus Promineifilaceae bacterium]